MRMTIGLGPRRRRDVLLLVAMTVAAAMIGACARDHASAPPALLGVPGRLNQFVSAATDGDAMVALAWAASSDSTGTDIYAAVSRDGGASFPAPVRVNAIAGQASVNGEQPPRVAIQRAAGGASIVVLWTAKSDDGTRLLYARSSDGGRTFGATVPMPSVDAPGNRGWESMAAAGNGQLYAVWLDHRDTAQAMSGHAHRHGEGTPETTDGVARAQRSQLFVGSFDGSLAPKGIARGVCYCCKTALATDADGAIYAAWRHVYAGNMRDIAFTRSRNGGHSFDEPVRVSEDAWQIDGCPENGPALAVDASKRIHVLWPTLVRTDGGETLRLFYSSSADGRTFSPRTSLPTAGAAYHPQQVVGPEGSLVAAWDEVRSAQRHVRAARGRVADGRMTFTEIPIGDDTLGTYPALAALRTHAVLAWAQRGEGEARLAVRRVDY